jgi:RNA polymerase sigma factor (sigma-70 family)
MVVVTNWWASQLSEGVSWSGDESDAVLLASAASDPEAFGWFYDRYERAITGFLLRRAGSPEVAADLTAEVFVSALLGSSRYRPDGETAAVWLFAIARNVLLESVRKGRVESAARLRAGMHPVVLEDETLAHLMAADGDRWVEELLAMLTAEQAQAIRLRVLDERDYREIAGKLRTSELVVRKRVSRGLQRLRERLEDAR